MARSAVAPFAGAWIEILPMQSLRSAGQSLPSRERGLKFPIQSVSALLPLSLPSRERGLKLYPLPAASHVLVAPFAGAWIEMV